MFIQKKLQLFKHVLIRPKYAFQQIEAHNISSIHAFLTILISFSAFWFVYLSKVDIAWLIDFTINTELASATAQERQQLSQQLNAKTISTTYLTTSFIMLIVQTLIAAIYLNIVTKLDEENTDTFKDWFGFYWWVQIPLVLQLLSSTLVVAFNTSNQISLHNLQLTSLNHLFNLSNEHPLFNLANSFDLFSIWSMVILFYGLSVKTNLKSSTVLNICLMPLAALALIAYFW